MGIRRYFMEESFNDGAQRQKNNAVNRALAATFQ